MESFCYPELFFTLSEPCRKQFQQHTKLTEVLVKAAPLLLQIGDLLLQEGEFFLAVPGQEAQMFKLLPEAALLQLESVDVTTQQALRGSLALRGAVTHAAARNLLDFWSLGPAYQSSALQSLNRMGENFLRLTKPKLQIARINAVQKEKVSDKKT